jgi:lambda family phage portal protein
MSLLDRILGEYAPVTALRRTQAKLALRHIQARYDAATTGPRGSSWSRLSSDANGAGAQRSVLATVARDMVRNTAFATRAQTVIANNVIGDGIIPKVNCKSKRLREKVLRIVERHFDTTAIDADGRANLYGLQRLALNCVVESGEVLIRRRRRQARDGLALPFQVQVMEPDFLSVLNDGVLPGGGIIQDGIEYDAIGRRVAYHLYSEHPGAMGNWKRVLKSDVRRVEASEIIHIYRQDRPGQQRGVTWFAPIALLLQDHHDYMDAQVMRQKIAALFTAFVTSPEADVVSPATSEDADGDGRFGKMSPGRLEFLAPGESIEFASPPAAEGFDEFNRVNLRAVAAGMGITYEALTGDLAQANFSASRMGRMEMDRNVSGWQWLLMIPQMMQPLGQWFVEAYEIQEGRLPPEFSLAWVPPHRMLIDPAREIPAMVTAIRAGLASRSGTVRRLGEDPERLEAEIRQDAQDADAAGLIFDSDPRKTAAGGMQHQMQGPDDIEGPQKSKGMSDDKTE